jgi:hypothetical protein
MGNSRKSPSGELLQGYWVSAVIAATILAVIIPNRKRAYGTARTTCRLNVRGNGKVDRIALPGKEWE